MGFPFSLMKRAPGVVYTWEKNDWSRRHGYQMPIDMYLILQWICLLLLDSGFFCFLIYFTTRTSSAEAELPLEVLLKELPQTTVNDPLSSWNSKIMIGLTTLVKLLSLSTSMVETEDPAVSKQRHQINRSQTYTRRYGIPVIDSFTGICNICRIKVSKQTRHCKLCNKCVGRMDHHCKWLNCCVGESNYRLFITLVVSAFTALLWYSYIACFVVWSCFCDKKSFIMNGLRIFHVDLQNADLSSINRIYHISAVVTVLITLTALISLVSITRLLLFHIKLAKMNITTIEYLNLPTYKSDSDSDYMDDDDEYDDYDSDYYYSEARVWKESSPKLYHKWAIYRLYRMIAHKLRRAWIVALRAIIPNYYYRRLKNTKRRTCSGFNCCSVASSLNKKPHLLPTMTGHALLENQSRSITKAHDDVNMDDFFATRTIRPTIASSENEDELDYNDEMGLDLTILEDDENFVKPKVRNSSNKLARLLDMSEEDALERVQQEQRQQLLLTSIDIPKEEDAPNEL
ncbi:DHHC palmitoyltransferase-domain-containing protein [Parasitella parasitica]|nr:DHHC palmitoyltransferase-domain-containing protein [Parasitella parasitica]